MILQIMYYSVSANFAVLISTLIGSCCSSWSNVKTHSVTDRLSVYTLQNISQTRLKNDDEILYVVDYTDGPDCIDAFCSFM